jgi:hypothetical protein
MGTEFGPLLAPTAVAGSPGINVLGAVVLKTAGNSVPGKPLAMSASPDKGPKENMYVCVPSPIVAKPSPPEICWHLMAPFTVPAVGTAYPLGAGYVNCVGPLYGGSTLLTVGLLVGFG